MQKEDRKNVRHSQSYVKKSDFVPPFWFEPQLLTHLTKYALVLYCLQKHKSIVEIRT
jgi:hypothetical protein